MKNFRRNRRLKLLGSAVSKCFPWKRKEDNLRSSFEFSHYRDEPTSAAFLRPFSIQLQMEMLDRKVDRHSDNKFSTVRTFYV